MTDPQPDPQPEVDRIVADLRAALDAVEAAARKAKPGPWTQDGGSIYATHPTDEVVDWVYDDSWEHIALNDPATVLRLVAAHRQILELHQPEPGQHPDFCGHDRHQMPCPTLLALAEGYAGRGQERGQGQA